eukprot:CAMPEP_0171077712 /NCGR_PEP_ID=MMETSP0766_2-20121228/14200_1 /TAXON_ID=439317 /ORGANISM="Gambierdiscus australes, Strain CAWD 149" /LENGTH=218 /DNA_ID=CAMNT_0011534787 /DNA_START=1 /DNA_END=657 /DNA_ORIENTATION=+
MCVGPLLGARAHLDGVENGTDHDVGELHQLWGTPVFANLVSPKAAEINRVLAAYMQRLAATEPPEIRSNRNGAWQSRNKVAALEAFLDPRSHAASAGVRGHVKRLRKAILTALRQYVDGLLQQSATPLGYEVSIDASWANVNPPCAINGPHVHPFAAISGAYYVDCGGNTSVELQCDINLMDPRPSAPLAHLPAQVRDSMDFGTPSLLSSELWALARA